MATMHKDQILQLRGGDLLDRDGDKIGSIEEIYLDAETNEPEWALVSTGMFGTKSTFVPIGDASQEDGALRVPYEKSQVKDAPKMEPDGQLSQREEAGLYRHYGREYSDVGSGGGAGTDAGTQPTGRSDAGRGGDDDAMTRSEEELRVGTTERESGRVRLRKYVETEEVQQTVPVRREKARLEREPISDANVDDATAGPDISEDEHEVVLHEEEVVAEKRAVPKERVRLEKDQVTDEREVSDTVRKERVDVDDSGR